MKVVLNPFSPGSGEAEIVTSKPPNKGVTNYEERRTPKRLHRVSVASRKAGISKTTFG
jgi:hypothetical protein